MRPNWHWNPVPNSGHNISRVSRRVQDTLYIPIAWEHQGEGKALREDESTWLPKVEDVAREVLL